jgi:hypothetical protein
MAVRVSPTEKTPSHHLSLSDGTNTLGLLLSNGKGEKDVRGIKQSGYPRSVTRISQNVAGYSDFELPYSPQVQQDWSGGRGLEDFDRDTTRFFDSYRADTTRGDIVCGPYATLTAATAASTATPYADGTLFKSPGSMYYYACKIAPSTGARTVRSVRVRVRGAYQFSVSILGDAAGQPDGPSMLESGVIFGNYTDWTNIDVPLSATLSANTPYWIQFYSAAGDFDVAYGALTGNQIWTYRYEWALSVNNAAFYYSLDDQLGSAKFFEYKGILFAALSPDNGTAARLYYNGYFGKCTVGSLIYMDSNISVGADLTGAVVKIIAGTGADEEINYRTVISNTTGADAVIEVDPPWKVPPDDTTVFVILGTNTWRETAAGLTKPVTDVLVVDDVIYLAQGEGTAIRRGKLKADGTWETWTDDGTNKATFLGLIPDAEGKKKVWMVKSAAASVSCSDAKAWGTNLAPMATWLTCGSTDSKITGLEAFAADGLLIPYIFKEDGFGSIGGTTTDKVGVYAEHPLSAQIKKVRSEKNGRAHMRYDLFLKFSLLDGLESHFDQRLDDIGPNRDEGLPIDRRGPIVHLMPYAGRFYAAVDGGDNGYSAILCCTQDNCWHEIYRGALGVRISQLAIQVIPGGSADRLWFSTGSRYIYWMPVAIDPRKQTDYTYSTGARVITASIYCGFKDVTKYFDSLTLFAENLVADEQYVTAHYQTDNEVGTDTWQALPAVFSTSPSQTIKLSAANNVSGKRIRLRLILSTTDPTKTPRIKALRLDSVIRLKPKKMWTVTYLVKDNMLDLSGMPCAPITSGQPLPEDTQAWLDNFADSDTTACPVTLRHLRAMFDNKTVFVEPNSISPLTQVTTPNGETVQLGSFNLLEA